MSSGGVILGPAGSVGGSLVLSNGQFYGPTADAGLPGGGGPLYMQQPINPNVYLGKSYDNGRNAVLANILVFVATGLSVVEAYLLAVSFDCLMASQSIRVIGLTFSGVSLSLAIIGSGIECYHKVKERGEKIESEKQGEELVQKKSHCLRNFGQVCEDFSILFALLPSLMNLVFKAPDLFSKGVSIIVLAAALLPFRLRPDEAYCCRKVFSCITAIGALAMFVFTFLSAENDKSLVIYNFTDSRTNQTFRIARQEDQIAYDGTFYCETFQESPCSPCFTTAVYGRGNNTWTPYKNETGECDGVTLSVDQAFDCTNFGERKPFNVSVFEEDSCTVNAGQICYINILPGTVIS